MVARMESLSPRPHGCPSSRVAASLHSRKRGILGKLALWRALIVVAETDDRLAGVDLEHLAARAQAQHAKVEESRLLVARTIFSKQ